MSTASLAAAPDTLPVDDPPQAVTDLTVSQPSLYTFQLTWTAPGNQTSLGDVSYVGEYKVRYSIAGEITEAGWNSATPVTLDVPEPDWPGLPQTMTISFVPSPSAR